MNQNEDEIENAESVLEKENFSLSPTAIRSTDEELLKSIRESLCTCGDCNIKFIKRKTKLVCPICHSTNII